MDIADAKRAYQAQRKNAAARGIEWRLTFEQWLDWWGEDLDQRGRGRHELSMQRPCDSGPYALDNIRKGTPKDNGRTRAAMHIKPSAAVVCSGEGWRVTREEEPDLGYALSCALLYG